MFFGAISEPSAMEIRPTQDTPSELVKLLFHFFRRDNLAIIRLYRDKVIRLGIEGRWVLEGMKKHPDEKVRQAATAMLKNYDKLRP